MIMYGRWTRWGDILTESKLKRRIRDDHIAILCRGILIFCLKECALSLDDATRGILLTLATPLKSSASKEPEQVNQENPVAVSAVDAVESATEQPTTGAEPSEKEKPLVNIEVKDKAKSKAEALESSIDFDTLIHDDNYKKHLMKNGPK